MRRGRLAKGLPLAILDASGNAVVIRVVYDGAPLAGKTTSVGALGRGLGASVQTPAEINGRTLYFDWLDYTGGLFEGHRIRCQIVSAPGQASLAARRRRLLESADVVVFVGDSSPAGFDTDHAYLRSLGSVLKHLSGPPVGIVLQANKRDLPDAVPLDRMREMLDDCGMKIGIIETVAKDGTGIREAFVFAVRLALDRVRELMRQGLLVSGRPDIDSADELLADLREHAGSALDLAVEQKLAHTRLSDLRPGSMAAEALEQAMRSEQDVAPMAGALTAQAPTNSAPIAQPTNPGVPTPEVLTLRAPHSATSQSAAASPGSPPAGASSAAVSSVNGSGPPPPALPSERVASGLVWPPVDGRVILQEIAGSAVSLKRLEDGAWYGRIGNRWHVRAPADAVYETVEQGRPALIALARAYATKAGSDSIERCAVLADDGAGRVRLWRIKRVAN